MASCQSAATVGRPQGDSCSHTFTDSTEELAPPHEDARRFVERPELGGVSAALLGGHQGVLDGSAGSHTRPSRTRPSLKPSSSPLRITWITIHSELCLDPEIGPAPSPAGRERLSARGKAWMEGARGDRETLRARILHRSEMAERRDSRGKPVLRPSRVPSSNRRAVMMRLWY